MSARAPTTHARTHAPTNTHTPWMPQPWRAGGVHLSVVLLAPHCWHHTQVACTHTHTGALSLARARAHALLTRACARVLTCAWISVKRGPVPACAASLCRLLLSATDPALSTCPTAAPGRSRCATANSRLSPPTCAQARARARRSFWVHPPHSGVHPSTLRSIFACCEIKQDSVR